MSKTLKTRITQKFDTVANWQASTLPLLKGELAIDDLNRIKIGVDGQKTWSEITTFAVDPTAIKPAVQSISTLPETSSQDLVPGNLVLTEDGKLWCLIETPAEDPQEPAERSWVDLTNNAEIQSLRTDLDAIQSEVSGIESGLVALKTAVDDKDKAHDAAIVALQGALSSDFDSQLDAVRLSVAQNAESIGANHELLEGILDSEDTSKVKLSAIPEAIYTNGKINSAALPSFVDDVIEGLVCRNASPSDLTYQLTHGQNDVVVGFFGASGADNSSERELKLITALTPEEEVDLDSIQPYVENNITYKFPAQAVATKQMPSSSVIYVDVMTNKSYRWSGSQFVVVAGDIALGTTASSAFYGDRGLAVEEEVFGVEENGTTTKVGLKERVATLETDLADEAAARVSGDEANAAAVVALANECQSKHQELADAIASGIQDLEDELASSIVALKQESEQADSAHEAALVAMQQQIAAANSVTFNDVVLNSGNTLNTETIIIDCGGASA